MTMLMARKDQDGALRVFQSCWWLISLMLGVTGALMCVALWLRWVIAWRNNSALRNW